MCYKRKKNYRTTSNDDAFGHTLYSGEGKLTGPGLINIFQIIITKVRNQHKPPTELGLGKTTVLFFVLFVE